MKRKVHGYGMACHKKLRTRLYWSAKEIAAAMDTARYKRANFKAIPVLRGRTKAAIATKRHVLRKLELKASGGVDKILAESPHTRANPVRPTLPI